MTNLMHYRTTVCHFFSRTFSNSLRDAGGGHVQHTVIDERLYHKRILFVFVPVNSRQWQGPVVHGACQDQFHATFNQHAAIQTEPCFRKHSFSYSFDSMLCSYFHAILHRLMERNSRIKNFCHDPEDSHTPVLYHIHYLSCYPHVSNVFVFLVRHSVGDHPRLARHVLVESQKFPYRYHEDYL